MTRQHGTSRDGADASDRRISAVTRASARPVPERNEDLAHLSLDRLRVYRTALSEEENRVSYWRRIIQARLDLIRSGARADQRHLDSLGAVLRGSGNNASRGALVTVVPVDDIPPLPDLAELWERDVRPDDAAYTRDLALDLEKAEGQLSAYRLALHGRIAAATGELIARYREEPGLCLAALPYVSDQQRRAAI